MATHFIKHPMSLAEINKYYAEIVRSNPADADDRLSGVTSVTFYVPVKKDPVAVATACLVLELNGTIRRVLHIHNHARTTIQDMVFVRNVSINAKYGNLPYPYTFRSGDDFPIPPKNLSSYHYRTTVSRRDMAECQWHSAMSGLRVGHLLLPLAILFELVTPTYVLDESDSGNVSGNVSGDDSGSERGNVRDHSVLEDADEDNRH